MVKIHDRIGAIVLLLVCGLAWTGSERFPTDAVIFPRMVIAFLAILSVVMLAKTFVGGRPSGPDRPFFINGRRFTATAAAIVVYIYGVSVLGYFTATVAFLPLTAWKLGYRKAGHLAVMAVSFCAIIFLVFVALFERPLPAEWILKIL
ncbi:tripartite tricarboxylate transporter TctB family protein [Shumkonia mesophila]|uniref:tripartite tricarboxylate transporter TctB family protein n=1 Tax=Shumkonia mesophila TaxID=2838854 RepID=UPI002934258D|nr:tripartite tricarboxylate transporter TctB family protein [Shumkonia mesophila]